MTNSLLVRVDQLVHEAVAAVTDPRVGNPVSEPFPNYRSPHGNDNPTPLDALGAIERLSARPDRRAWRAASMMQRGPSHSEWQRWTGLYSAAGGEALVVTQGGAPATRFPQVWAAADAEVTELYDDPWQSPRPVWGPPLFFDQGDPAPPEPALSDTATAVAALGLADVEPSAHTDRAGRPFLQYECLSRSHDHRVRSVISKLFPTVAVLGIYPPGNGVYAVDLWTDDDERLERVRVRSGDGPHAWAELHLLHDLLDLADLPETARHHDQPVTAGWAGHRAWEPALTVPLRVEVDDAGRPYDVVPRERHTIRHETVATVPTDDGHVLVVDGNALCVALDEAESEASILDFGETATVMLQIVWERGDGRESVLGVRMDIPDTVVDHWAPLEVGYGTDGGVGGVTIPAVVAAEKRLADRSLSARMEALTDQALDDGTGAALTDLDGDGRPDTLVWENGRGDGGFPMTRGFDANGQLVAAFIWDLRYPFRLAVPDGTPPLEITRREEQFIECLEGRRPVGPGGSCPTDDEDPWW